MAGRPVKGCADWFPHFANASDASKTLAALENRYGSAGYMAWFKLLERLTGAPNHTLSCKTTDETEFLAAKLKLTPEQLELIVGKMAHLGGIDPELWQHRILWSQNLVDNLAPVYEKRRQKPPQRPGISGTEIAERQTAISGTETPISATETPISVPESAASRVERVERVERESRVEPTHPTLPSSRLVTSDELVGSALESFKLIQENLTKLRGADLIEARSACQGYSPEWIRAAVQEACEQNKRTWKYTAAILRRWKSEGRR